MQKYLLTIKKPIQIPAIAFEIQERAKQDEMYVLLLHEEEPNIVRGGPELLNPRDGIEVVRRPDGGNSWYHSRSSRCITYARPANESKSMQKNWGDKVARFFKDFSQRELTYDSGDLYDNRQQVVGLSARVDPKEGFRIHRACWYEADPREDITRLLNADGVDPEEFLKNASLGTGFFDYLIGILKPEEIGFEDYVSKQSLERALQLQKMEMQKRPTTCVGGLKIKI